MMNLRTLAPGLALILLAASGPVFLTGCVPAVIAVGVGAGAMVATDRRSTGVQVDDETIEDKVTLAAGNKWGNTIHLNVTSYNGIVLLTGEAPTAAIKDEIMRMTTTTDRVKSVANEIVVGAVTDLGARTNDSYLTSVVKARFVEAGKFAPNHVKVITERSIVYLIGIVSREEGNAAAQIAATTSGVARVVKLFQYTN
jgi:osmotically-inducible protein OsmY